MNEPGGHEHIERLNVKLPSFKELTKSFSGTPAIGVPRLNDNPRVSLKSITRLETIPRTIPVQQQASNGNYVFSAYYQMPLQGHVQTPTPAPKANLSLQIPAGAYQTGVALNSRASVPETTALAQSNVVAHANNNLQSSEQSSQPGYTFSNYNGFNTSPSSQTAYQRSAPISPMSELPESPLKHKSQIPASLDNLRRFLVDTKQDINTEQYSTEAVLAKLNSYNNSNLRSLEYSTSKFADFLKNYRIGKKKDSRSDATAKSSPSSIIKPNRRSSHLRSRSMWPSTMWRRDVILRNTVPDRKNSKKSTMEPSKSNMGFNKYKRHAHSRSDTMAIGINKNYKDNLAWDQSYSMSDNQSIDEDQQGKQSFEQLSPGEKITLKVEPLEPAINNRARSSFAPQGILHQDLSIKPKIKCMQCGSESTPEWRKGPDGARTLCNACGLFHNKMVKKLGPKAAAEFLETKRMRGKPGERQFPH